MTSEVQISMILSALEITYPNAKITVSENLFINCKIHYDTRIINVAWHAVHLIKMKLIVKGQLYIKITHLQFNSDEL